MAAGDQQRGDDEATHRRSVAQKLGCLWLAIVVACASEPDPAQLEVDPDDLDGDGIPNASDSCPSATNPLQHDEDGDAIGDECDLCPAIADPAQTDLGEELAMQFADGVGDACDPQGARGGDVLAAFHPFTVDTSSQWLGDGWAIGADVARTVTTARWQHRVAEQGDGLFVQAHVAAVVWLSAPASVAVVADGDGSFGFTCAVVRDRDGDGFDELDVYEGNTLLKTTSLGAPVSGPLVLTVWRAIDFRRDAFLFCRVVHQGVNRELVIEGLGDFTTGMYTFASRGAITDIASLTVYTFPVGPCVSTGRLRECNSEP